jgi:hypothetical protein
MSPLLHQSRSEGCRRVSPRDMLSNLLACSRICFTTRMQAHARTHARRQAGRQKHKQGQYSNRMHAYSVVSRLLKGLSAAFQGATRRGTVRVRVCVCVCVCLCDTGTRALMGVTGYVMGT